MPAFCHLQDTRFLKGKMRTGRKQEAHILHQSQMHLWGHFYHKSGESTSFGNSQTWLLQTWLFAKFYTFALFCALLRSFALFCALFRKILVSVKFVSAILGPEMAAPILWTPGKNAFFLQENLHVHKIPRFRGVFWVFLGGGVPILFLWALGFFRSFADLH